ncbi:hypothetical protein Bca52824_095691 [Brassica carinata]|uniref:Leucine-rich repeat-containing N-terminal plant-type domain-containing protein n=1 Tax=Brassica carinata TaxID=52824 RepID=A0A8X7NYI9_BRACI|nr:hypothetical protein Bca52824_095691 [Brassica carinata]
MTSSNSSMMSIFLRTIVLLYSISRILSTFASSPDQSDILLEFKNEFKIHKSCEFLDPKTKSWANKSDYCNWQGVTCETKSDKVIGLDLSCSCLHGRLKPNSSLFRLQHLRSLNLAYNSFLDSTIPAKFNKLMGLERLNLSESSFSGQIPTEIVQLTNLVSLDLSSYRPSNLSIEEPSFIRLLALNLRNLRELHMSYVNISSEIPKEFSNMSSLRSLTLENCNLLGIFPSNVFVIPNLHLINLNDNPKLRGQLPDFHVNKSLQRISIDMTSFSGIIPSSLGNLSHLSFLRLSSNNFIGEIPSSIGNLKQLISFDVFSNKLSGNFPSALLNLTQLRSTLDLSYNQFSGSLPPNISQLSRLDYFSVGGNSFVGVIPASLFKISSLTRIDLDINQFSDLLGIENISLLPNLEYLFLDDNNYSVNVIPVDLNLFPPLKHLTGLSLSGIPLSTTNITSDFSSDFETLYLSGCKITEFPEFIRNIPNLYNLDLSNNKMKGLVPDWLWRLPELDYLDLSRNSFSGFNGSLNLSSNAFQGPLFIPSSSIEFLFASKNNFTGELPSSICGSTSLYILDLSNNNFSGSIPWCFMTSLGDLKLHNNSLNGTLPDIFINATKLLSLDVSHNLLEGKLPASLINCSSLQVLNLESNKFKDTFPFQLSSLPNLQVLVLRSNNFYGKLHHSDGVWSGFPQLKIIDVSHNDFLGTLPSDYFLNWTGISSKTGDNSTEPDYIGAFLAHRYYTSIVRIEPTSQQSKQPVSLQEEEEEGWLSWMGAGIGFAPGVVFGITIGYIVTSYKIEWFMKIFGLTRTC